MYATYDDDDETLVRFQVNGLNVEWADYSRVAEMIRAGGNKLDLLVVDEAADRYFDREQIALLADRRLVDVIVCPDDKLTAGLKGLRFTAGRPLVWKTSKTKKCHGFHSKST